MMRKKIVVLATGGTIAGVGEVGANTGYRSGQIAAADLMADLLKDKPELLAEATIETEQICNVNSDDMTDKLLIKLACRLQELQDDESVHGIVITHGTDTMDETAYFISLTVKCKKAVIFTGSMRPATASTPDGPENLKGAIQAAVEFTELSATRLDSSTEFDSSLQNKVWVYFAGGLYDARQVQKCSASALNAMGVNYPGEGSRLNAPQEQNYFDVRGLQQLPTVSVLYFSLGADPRLVSYGASISDGLVIAGAGSGEFSQEWAKALAAVKIPVVIASRIHHGLVTVNRELAPGGIGAGRLPPQKAAILLKLALTATHKVDEIKRIFAL